MSTNAYMTNRALKSLSKEISAISENLNTWAVSLKHLIKLRRNLLNNKKADSDLYLVADAFSKLFYKNHAKVDNYHVNSDSEQEDQELTTNESQNAHDFQEEDIDETLRKIVANEKPKSKLTDMQLAALETLTAEEKEAEELNNQINRRRAQLNANMQKAQPSAPVKFTVDVDKTLDPKTGKPIEYEVDDNSDNGTILDEASLDSDNGKKTLITNTESNYLSNGNLLTTLNEVMSKMNNDKSLHPIIAMQKETPLFNGLPGFENTAVKSEPVKVDGISNFNPKFTPLLKLTAHARKELQYKWFKQAIENVNIQTRDLPISPKTRDRLIREETTRQQEYYCETH